MKYDRLYNFISPKTGKIILPTDYTLLGDNRGFSYASPILQHIKLDQIKLQKYLDDINFLIDTIFSDLDIHNNQRLNLKNMPLLGSAKFPLPNDDLFNSLSGKIPDIIITGLKTALNAAKTVPIPNPTFNPGTNLIPDLLNITNISDIPSALFSTLSNYIMFGPWLPQIISGNPNFTNTDTDTVISSAIAMLNINIANIFKRFDSAKLIVKTKKVTWDWDNPLYKLENIDPKIKAVMGLYNLNPEYNFSNNVQALEELLQDDPLNIGHKKGGILALNNEANMKLAVSGEDYVDYKDIVAGYLCLIDPLANANSDKFITKSGRVQVRDPDPDERVRVRLPEADWGVEEVKKVFEFTDIYLKFRNFINGITGKRGYSRLSQIDEDGFLVESAVKARFNNTNEFLPIEKTANVIEVDYLKVKNLIASEITNKFIKTDNTGKLVGTTDVFTKTEVNEIVNKAVEAVKLTLMGIIAKEVISIAGKAASESLFDFIGAAGKEVGKEIAKEAVKGLLDEMKTFLSTILAGVIGGLVGAGLASIYAEFLFNIKYKPMQSQNDIGDVDNLGNWGQGNLWFDANNKRGESTNDRSHHRPGLRVNVWDSSVAFESKLPPISIGLFGYKWNLISIFDEGDRQEGFVWESDPENDSSHSNYRFPKNIILKRVKSKANANGWNAETSLFGYDYYTDKFDFYKPVQAKSITVTDNLVIPVKQSSDIPLNSALGSMFFCSDL